MEGKGEIVIYQTQDGTTQLDVRLDGETVWITQDQMAQLFDRDRTAIGRHISNIFAEGELDRNMVCANFAHTTQHGASDHTSGSQESGQKGGQESGQRLPQKTRELLELLKKNPYITRKELSALLHISPSAIQKHIEKLKKGYIFDQEVILATIWR